MLTSLTTGLLLVIGAGLNLPTPASAEEMVSSAARGGRLYDKWYKVLKAPKPKQNHVSWPASNTKKKGKTTWRCKSCHGWDYKGKDGRYAKGSYKTGITGITNYRGGDPVQVLSILADKTHGMTKVLDDQELVDLALFVTQGQVDMDKYIDAASKKMKGGDAAKGSVYFNTICARCHDKDGRSPRDMAEPLGLAMRNPWEVMHKIMNGAPAEQMPALRAFDKQVIVDIMTYVATLPRDR